MSLLRLLCAALALFLAALLAAYVWYRQASQPIREGTQSVAGLAAPVEVQRDAHGVPTILAATESDALFALGFVHAQDRLWQLDFNRRIAQGRVAEVVGASALGADKFFRTLGIYRNAQRAADNLDRETRMRVEAYAAGVNAQLATRSGPLPPEFLLTRAPAPQPWTVADSVAWSMMMAWDLSSYSYRAELTRLRLSLRFTKAELDEFRPPYPGDAPPPVDLRELYRSIGLTADSGGSVALDATAQRLLASVPSAGFGAGEGVGSNNWVVAGSRTVSGKPLLANDPHLGLTTPSVWYFARLRAPQLDVFGATLPGVPYVLLGRNQNVAWGFTNTGTDVQDLYLERVNPSNPSEYQTPAGFAPFERRKEVIVVRGAAPVEFEFRATRHGPVISDVLEGIGDVLPPSKGLVLALRWTALEPSDTSLRAIGAMNRAANAAEFQNALRDWQLVQQNVVFADSAGHIGMVAPARVPIRSAANPVQGAAPVPGWDARYDWTGWLSFEQLPRVLDPPVGFIVTANHKITPPDYPYFITGDWNLPYRAERITQLIAATPKHDFASFARIQADVTSLAARDLLAALRALQPPIAPRSPAARAALQRLFAWDGLMGMDLPEPLIFHAWLRKLRGRVFDDDLGPLAESLVAGSELTLPLLNVLRGTASARDWCDDRTTTDRRETCSELAAEALQDAVAELTRNSESAGSAGPAVPAGPAEPAKSTERTASAVSTASTDNLLSLRWGDAHRVRHEHRPFSRTPGLRPLFELTTPIPGDSYTVNVGQLSLRKDAPFSSRHGASLRAIYDLAPAATTAAARSAGAWIYPTGQAGHPLSSHYGDLLSTWQKVEYLPLHWSPEQAPTRPATSLRLVPG